MTSTIKVNTIQDSCGSALVTKCGSNITIGASGKNILLACGANQTGFGRSGSVDWCTTAKTSPFTSESGKGYFVNTTSGAVTVTLPASPSAGDIVAIADYANTFACNAANIGRNSSKINGGCFDASLITNGQSVTLVYVDGTRGWKNVTDSTSNVSGAPTYIVATGGTITTSGDFKIHTFTSDSTFTIETAPTPANNKVDYFVLAGGAGGGGFYYGGGGGAGGFRESHSTPVSGSYTASPLATPTALDVSSQAYPIQVGGGGAGGSGQATRGVSGTPSIFSTITSAGGGGGGSVSPNITGASGGSGGGGGTYPSSSAAGGSGNTPPVSPPQGNNGGNGSSPALISGGGGGAGEAGNTDGQGHGGDGLATSINGTPTTRGGGGGGTGQGPISTIQPGGDGGGGASGRYSPFSAAVSGTANTGGGGGGGTHCANSPSDGGAGGSGLVIIRYKFQ